MQFFKKGKVKRMFISRKRLNQKIEEALQEAEEKRYIHNRIDYAMENADRRIVALERRVAILENETIKVETAKLFEAEATKPLQGFAVPE